MEGALPLRRDALGRLRRRDALERHVQAAHAEPALARRLRHPRGHPAHPRAARRARDPCDVHGARPGHRRAPRRVQRHHSASAARSATTATTTRACWSSRSTRSASSCAAGIGRIEDAFDTRPKGNRSPPFALGPNTADLLEENGFVYDSSLFGHDEPYRPRVPVTDGPLRDFVELPVSWELDDAPYFLFSFFPYMSGLSTPSQVLEIWKAEFDGSYARRRLLPARRAPVLHRPPSADRDARPALHVHQELPRRVVRDAPRGRRGVAQDAGVGRPLGERRDGGAGGVTTQLAGRFRVRYSRRTVHRRLSTLPRTRL